MINLRKRRRGLSTIEMAIILPLLLWLTLGLIEYGWMFLKAQQITNAARQGARVGARMDATSSDVQAAILSALTIGEMQGSGYSVSINPDPGVLDAAELFTVTVNVPYSNVTLGMPLVPTPGNLESSITMAKEGI